ncbi:MAG: amidohydrolase family protein, partial [archaeon]
GLLTISEKDLNEIAETAKATGYQVATHAIGDSANRLVLDAYEKILGENIAKYRWRIEHAQVLSPSDIPRFGKLGVIASMQPTHATSDMPWATARLGTKRIKGAYVYKSVWDGGAIVPGGSDSPVELADPLLGFYAAITRQDANGKPIGGWMPEQILDRSSALKMFTELPAYAAFQEKIKGRLEPGFAADFTILDKNLMTIPPKEILQTTVVMTVVGGEVKYRAIE